MQYLWFFLSVFFGIMGAFFVGKIVYRSSVNKAALYISKKKTKEKNYGRKS